MRPPRPILFLLAALTFAHHAPAGDLPAETIARLRLSNASISPSGDDRVTLHAFVPGDVDVRSLGMLPLAPGFASVRLRPDQVDAFVAARPTVHFGWHPPLRPRLDHATTWTRASAFRNTTGLDGSGVVVGIIDTGVDVTHPDLRNADGSTRIAWMLDLSRQPTGRHAAVEQDFGCLDPELGGCAVYDATDIDQAIKSIVGTDEPRDTVGHGTHVASIAAGNGLGSDQGALAGMAPGATIIAARVTRGSAEDISDADALLATRFVFERAKAMGMPAVVNMSLGADFGPHDGTSWLEQGLASFVGPDQPGRAVVVAAGNSGGLYLSGGSVFGIHTETRVYPHTRVRVPMQSVSSTGSTLRGTLYVWLTWRSGERLSLGIEGPDGETWVEPIAPGNTASFKTRSGGKDVETVILNDVRGEGSPIPEGTRGAVLLVDGGWSTSDPITILLEGDGTAEIWLQGVGEAGVSPSGLGMMFTRAVKHGTVNMPATHPSIIAVGATINRTDWRDANGVRVLIDRFGSQAPPIEDSMAYFSGSGPSSTGLPKPDISAPGVFVAAAMSRDADPSINPTGMFATAASTCPTTSTHCMVVGTHHAIATGTSMATPAVAGAVALLLSMDPTLTSPELLALIQAGARWPDGAVPYPFQMGPGVLDVERSREVYELLGQPRLREPDAKRSWIVVASPYARPDPSWPVCGFLETRTEDASIADGFDPGLMSLHVDGASVTRPLTRVAPGLWTFCIAAPSGSGGGTAHLEARFRNGQIGDTQHLPIAVDSFVAREGVVARGGCTATPAPSRADLHALLGLVAFLWLRRRC
jgi:subtilisin family serine protease